MLHAGGSRNRQNDRRSRQQPCQCHLRRRGFQFRGDAADGATGSRQLTGCQREPRDEPDPMLFAVFQHVFGPAIAHAVTILDADNRHNLLRVLDLADAHFRQSDVFDLPLCLQVLQRAELIFGRHFRVDPMQLIKIDPVETQTAQAAFAGGPQMLGSSVLSPLIRTRTFQAALGGDHESSRVRMESLGDNFFADIGNRSSRCR